MQKVSKHLGGITPSVDYRATVKSNTAPDILDSYINDDGELVYVLANGNEALSVKYDAIWNPPKSAIKPYSKGENPNGRLIK